MSDNEEQINSCKEVVNSSSENPDDKYESMDTLKTKYSFIVFLRHFTVYSVIIFLLPPWNNVPTNLGHLYAYKVGPFLVLSVAAFLFMALFFTSKLKQDPLKMAAQCLWYFSFPLWLIYFALRLSVK